MSIDPALLRRLLRYEPETGKLFWRERTPDLFRSSPRRRAEHSCAIWNATYAGKEAFTCVSDGYRTGAIFGRHVVAHRVAWALFYGEWPAADVDHRNGVRADNRIRNLRSATRPENSWNQRRKTNNSSGFKGVSWNKGKLKWRARIMKFGRERHLGYFNTLEDAHSAYCAASKEAHGEFGRVQ